MSDKKRVFITGYGAVTASGVTSDATWNAIQAGQHGFAPLTQWDLSSWTHRLVGEIKDVKLPAMLPDRKLMKVISRQDCFGINAAMQAVQHSQLLGYRESLPSPDSFNEQTAVYVGSPGNKYCQQYDFLPLIAKTGGAMDAFAEQLFDEVHPMWLLRILPNNVLAYTGITFGFKGINHNITNHAVSGMQALLEAYHAIQQGQAERAVVVAYDVGTEPQTLFYYEKLGVLSARHLKPFDTAHDGTLLAEGAAALIIESEDSASMRSATRYAELLGGASATEGAGLFSLTEGGQPLASLMKQVLDEQSIHPQDIGLLVAHGNGNQASDVSEALAFYEVFDDYAVPVTAFKWSMGHTMGASGLIDTVLATYAMRTPCVPGIHPLDKPAAPCAGLNMSAMPRQLDRNKPYTMVINRGFASMNACLVMKACD